MNNAAMWVRSNLGVQPPAIPLLVAGGIIAWVATVPGYFVSGAAWLNNPTLGLLRSPLRGLGKAFVSLYASELFSYVMPRAAGFSIILLVSMPFVSLVSAVRAGSWEPFLTVVATLLTSLFSLPILAWAFLILRWVWGVLSAIYAWLGSISSWASQGFSSISGLLVKMVLILIGIVWIVALFRSSAARKWTLFLAVLLGIGWLVVTKFHIQDMQFMIMLRDWVSTGWGAVASALGWLVGAVVWLFAWALKILLVLAVLVAVVGLLAQIGSTYWTPFVSAWTAGGRRSKTADFVAGSGVAMSVVLTAAVAHPSFGDWLTGSAGVMPGAGVVDGLVAIYSHIFPNELMPVASEVLRGVSGFPEFAVVAFSCLIGALSLILTSGHREDDGVGSVATFAFARTAIAVAVVIPVILLLWFYSRDT